MKNNVRYFITTAALALLLICRPASAQTAVQSTTTTTTSAGTITEFSPSIITVRSESSTTPVRYSYSKTTTYVDEAGNPVSMELVKSGLPVTVYYTKDGDNMVATKVVVRKTVTSDAAPGDSTTVEKKSTTTTTTDK